MCVELGQKQGLHYIDSVLFYKERAKDEQGEGFAEMLFHLMHYEPITARFIPRLD